MCRGEELICSGCRFLDILDYIEITTMSKEESASGIASYRVRITQDGLKAADILKRELV
ncbi:MAG: hypothetical protein CHKLHMKO_00722 [Candidatus Argoarchaeum ethanivorans]|uniref:Uncharacterized protein n=1 Tax=Candidatus Argoarchaeum ethanivorans TaxID=2608793 RepID=A0A811TAF5_9EURY|nr:MAG: hypothetical protein CHKLHMKO_00722 [Candidatus Argoarchaeum ethanivorans]